MVGSKNWKKIYLQSLAFVAYKVQELYFNNFILIPSVKEMLPQRESNTWNGFWIQKVSVSSTVFEDYS